MKCVFCKHGDTRPGEATVTLERGATIVVIKKVPADICSNCGEYYLSTEISETVLVRAEEAAKNGGEVEILRFAA